MQDIVPMMWYLFEIGYGTYDVVFIWNASISTVWRVIHKTEPAATSVEGEGTRISGGQKKL